MSRPLNDRLVQLYNNLDTLNTEFRRRIANLDDIANFTVELVSDLVDRRHNTLKAIGKFKNEADKNFLVFIQKAMGEAKSVENYKIIKRLIEIKNNVSDRERLVIIDDTFCVNESKEEEVRALLNSLEAKKEDTLDIPSERDDEAPVLSIEDTYQDKVQVNNRLREAIERYLASVEDIKRKYTYEAKNGKEIAKEYVKDYDRLLNVLEFLNIREDDIVEKVLNIAYIPVKLKDAFIEALANTAFYHENYDSKLINADLITELNSHLEEVSLEEEQAIRQMISLLSVENKKLIRVWNVGYVAAKDVAMFKDLVLKSSYLRSRVEMEPLNKEVLDATLDELNSLDDASLEEREALMTKYTILKKSIDSKRKAKASDGASIPSRYLKEYEKTIDKIKEVRISKSEALVPIDQDTLIDVDLKRKALETLQDSLLKRKKSYDLDHTKMLELFGLPRVVAEPKKAQPTYDVEAILRDALREKPEEREEALDAAINKILGRDKNLKETTETLPAPVPVLKKRDIKDNSLSVQDISEYMGRVFEENKALASQDNMKMAISQILDTLTEGKSKEIDGLLKEVKAVLANSKSPIKPSDSQLVVSEDLPRTRIVSRVDGTRKWYSFKNFKIFCKSLMAASLVDEDERLGRNPYVSRLVKIVDNIVERCKMALGDEATRNNRLNDRYYMIRGDEDTARLTEALNNPELHISDYDTILITGIIKSEKLIKEASAKINELVTYIRNNTKKRFQFEYMRMADLQKEIEGYEEEIAEAKRHHTPDSETIIYRNEDLIDIAKREIREIELYITEHSEELYISEYARLNVLNASINNLREKQALAQIKLYENAKEREDQDTAQNYRDAVMRLTSLDLDKYFDLNSAREDVRNLMSLDSDNLVNQMNYVIGSLDELLKDTLTYPEINRIGSDIHNLKESVNSLSENSVGLFK